MLVLSMTLFSKNFKKEFDKILKPAYNKNTPSISVAVIENDKIIYKKAFGMASLELNVPATTKSVYRIGSLSKQITGAAIAMLIQDGKIKPTDKIINYFPELPAEVYGEITIEQMLFHTSGIRDSENMYPLMGMAYSQWYTHDMLMEMLKRQKGLSFTPGSQYEYSNSAYTLLALIVERVSGEIFCEFVKEKIFDPLGMENTTMQTDDKTFIPNRTAGYKKVDEQYVNWMTNNQLLGHDAVYSSVEDLFLWQQALNKGKIGNYDLAIMKVPGKFNDGTFGNYGYGLVTGKYRGLDYYCHDGWYVGYKAFIMTIPKKEFSIILLSNQGNKYVRGYGIKMVEAYFKTENFITETLGEIKPNVLFKLPKEARLVRKSIGGFKTIESIEKSYFQSPDKDNEFWTADHLNKFKMQKNDDGLEFIQYTSYGSRHKYAPFVEIETNDRYIQKISGKYFSNELDNCGKIYINDSKVILEVGLNKSELIQVFPDKFASEDCMITIQKDEYENIVGFVFSTYSVRGIIFMKEKNEN